jgi:hypothetical protein
MPGVPHSTSEWQGKRMQNWLKNVLVAGFLAISAARAAEPQVPPPTTTAPSHAHGVHGMILFGEPGRVFASHLPLYRHPHDWQVVLELQPVGTDAQRLADQLLAEGGLLTIEPERFDLWRLKPGASEPLRQFKAVLYRDHFERGGDKLRELAWQVKRVWQFAPVGVSAAAQGHHYYVIGLDDCRQTGWLLHQVERRPDTDQVLRISANTALPARIQVEQLLGKDSVNAGFRVDQVVWQDSDDLQ